MICTSFEFLLSRNTVNNYTCRWFKRRNLEPYQFTSFEDIKEDTFGRELLFYTYKCFERM